LTVYADSSFFVSLYVQDVHSNSADRLLGSGLQPWFTPLHFAEFAHAVGQQVFRGQMSMAEARHVHAQLEKDRGAGLWIEIALPNEAFQECADLARRHAPRLGVRTLDSLHVACASLLKAERFWTFDERQAKLAKAEGMKAV
jgi:predicted nucleic acid-binding protein